MDIENLDWYYEDCVIGGPGAFMISVRGTEAFLEGTRTKLVLDIASAPQTKPLVRHASTEKPRVSCYIGEMLWRQRMGEMMRFAFARLSLALAVALAIAPAARADNAPPPIIEGQARVLPVLAKNGMVVAQEGKAARIGVDILKRGGNAVDAAVAVGFALAVTLPRAGNLGGGGFMLIHRAEDREDDCHRLSRDRAGGDHADVFLDANGNADPYQVARFSGLADRRAGHGRRSRA